MIPALLELIRLDRGRHCSFARRPQSLRGLAVERHCNNVVVLKIFNCQSQCERRSDRRFGEVLANLDRNLQRSVRQCRWQDAVQAAIGVVARCPSTIGGEHEVLIPCSQRGRVAELLEQRSHVDPRLFAVVLCVRKPVEQIDSVGPLLPVIQRQTGSQFGGDR